MELVCMGSPTKPKERPQRGRPFPTILSHSENYREDTIAPAARSLRTTAPPFITNFTRCISVMSVSGSPATAIMSANLPFSIVPRLSALWMISALTVVAMRRVYTGLAPHLTKMGNISPCTPWEQLHSVLYTLPGGGAEPLPQPSITPAASIFFHVTSTSRYRL